MAREFPEKSTGVNNKPVFLGRETRYSVGGVAAWQVGAKRLRDIRRMGLVATRSNREISGQDDRRIRTN